MAGVGLLKGVKYATGEWLWRELKTPVYSNQAAREGTRQLLQSDILNQGQNVLSFKVVSLTSRNLGTVFFSIFNLKIIAHKGTK